MLLLLIGSTVVLAIASEGETGLETLGLTGFFTILGLWLALTVRSLFCNIQGALLGRFLRAKLKEAGPLERSAELQIAKACVS
jgi:hypothetical protein